MGTGYILESLNLQTSWDNTCICNKSFLVYRWSLRGHITLLCVYVPAPEGKACCRKTAAEFGLGVSGVSACSRHKRLPTGPPSPLHKETQTFILNEVNKGRRFPAHNTYICSSVKAPFSTQFPAACGDACNSVSLHCPECLGQISSEELTSFHPPLGWVPALGWATPWLDRAWCSEPEVPLSVLDWLSAASLWTTHRSVREHQQQLLWSQNFFRFCFNMLPFQINLLFIFKRVQTTIRKVLHEVLFEISQVLVVKPCILERESIIK